MKILGIMTLRLRSKYPFMLYKPWKHKKRTRLCLMLWHEKVSDLYQSLYGVPEHTFFGFFYLYKIVQAVFTYPLPGQTLVNRNCKYISIEKHYIFSTKLYLIAFLENYRVDINGLPVKV